MINEQIIQSLSADYYRVTRSCCPPEEAQLIEMSEEDILLVAETILANRLYEPDFYARTPEDTLQYLRLIIGSLEHESFRGLFLDNQHGLIAEKELFRGTIDSATVYPREVMKAALEFNAAAMIFSHNHPSGKVDPSVADKKITERLVSALNLIDVRTLDHIIIAGEYSYSFAEHGLL